MAVSPSARVLIATSSTSGMVLGSFGGANVATLKKKISAFDSTVSSAAMMVDVRIDTSCRAVSGRHTRRPPQRTMEYDASPHTTTGGSSGSLMALSRRSAKGIKWR